MNVWETSINRTTSTFVVWIRTYQVRDILVIQTIPHRIVLVNFPEKQLIVRSAGLVYVPHDKFPLAAFKFDQREELIDRIPPQYFP